MSLNALSWYITGILALLFLVASAITYAPGIEVFGFAVSIAALCGAVIGVFISLYLGRLPREHWVHRSRSVRRAFAAAAIGLTILLLLVG
ncbi:MAG TPA: hypothetical protein VN641_04570 [Urbifossiella sp.]|nr:hypothetical protein [Urbifossiella sp.]